MRRIEALIVILIAIAMGVVGTVTTFGLWTLMPWAAAILVAVFFVEVNG
ncbi:membrane protein [Rhodococcus phage Jflix2]|nr:membrane protein [Rhodococcus phage Jflix2]